MSSSERCKECGHLFSFEEGGVNRCLCPSCGSTKRTIDAELNSGFAVADFVKYESVREFYEKNPTFLLLSILLLILSPFLGFLFAGAAGVLVGIVFSVASYFLSPLAMTKVREIRKG